MTQRYNNDSSLQCFTIRVLVRNNDVITSRLRARLNDLARDYHVTNDVE